MRPLDKYTTRLCVTANTTTPFSSCTIYGTFYKRSQQRNSWLLLVSKHTHLYPGYLFNVITYGPRAVFLYAGREIRELDVTRLCCFDLPTHRPNAQRVARDILRLLANTYILCLSLQKIISSRCCRLYCTAKKRKWIHVHLLENIRNKKRWCSVHCCSSDTMCYRLIKYTYKDSCTKTINFNMNLTNKFVWILRCTGYNM